MTTREFEDLINQYLDNEISQENLARLKRAVNGNELLRTRFNQACKLHLAERTAMKGNRARTTSARLSAGPPTTHPPALEEFQNWQRPRPSRQQRRSEHERHSASSAKRPRRKIYWLFPFWIGVVVCVMGYALFNLPTETSALSARLSGDRDASDADLDRAARLSSTPGLALVTQSPSSAPLPSATISDRGASSAGSGNTATFAMPGSSLPTMTEKPAISPATDHVTALVPEPLKDIAQANTPPAQTETASVRLDAASQRLEQALEELFQSSAY